MSVFEAVERDIARIRLRSPELADSAEAAAALALAAEIDGNNSATSKSMCATALSKLMGDLRALLPEEKKGDRLDDLESKRAARLARRAASAPAVPS